MITANSETGTLVVKGNGIDILNELSVVISEIEKDFVKEFGTKTAKKIIDVAIEESRCCNCEYND